MREARNRCRAIVGVGIFAEQNDDDGTGPPHVPPTLVSSQRVERLSRVVVRGLWTAQQTARPQPASRGRRTHRVRALESAERISARPAASPRVRSPDAARPDFGSQKLTSRGAERRSLRGHPADSRPCRRVMTPRRGRPPPVGPPPNRAARPRPMGRRTSGNCRCQMRRSRAFAPR